MTPGYDEPIDEWASHEPMSAGTGCLLAFLVGWGLACAFVTGMAIASYW